MKVKIKLRWLLTHTQLTNANLSSHHVMKMLIILLLNVMFYKQSIHFLRINLT